MNETDDYRPPQEQVTVLGPDRLVMALREYQEAIERGEKPNRRELLARYPDIAEELTAALAGLDFLNSAGPRLRPQDDKTSAPAPPIEGTLGDFRLVREIGRGGMGIVYEAVQISLGRPVALKVLPFASTLDPRRLQRFRTEAQAAAQLHHTNIVPVYFVGQERGVHFYAMQLIDGQSLAGVVRQISSSAIAPASALDPSVLSGMDVQGGKKGEHERETCSAYAATLTSQRSIRPRDYYRSITRLILQAAEALEHAHQFGIIHRDVKPANLLVDAGGRLWVTDFGLAQVQNGADVTRTGDLVGTLRYMSPEQAGGQSHVVDPRTDVYSLGATLYELVTLAPIFPGRNHSELLQQILHEEPKAPRTHNRSVPVELETIILKSVSKSPGDRYSSAQALADDLRRFLNDQPVLARRPTAVDRARKWARRHPEIMWGGLLALSMLAAVLAASTLMIAREQSRTLQRAEEAEQQFRMARRSVDEMIQLSEEELADNPGSQRVRKRMLEAALSYYQEFIEQRREDPAAQADLSVTRDRVKQILDDLAVLQGAGQILLLSEPTVLDDLKARPDQREQLKELSHRQGERRDRDFREYGRLNEEERRQRFLELARSNEAAIAAILDRRQIDRLRQIALQLQGPSAFRDPDIAAALHLTAEQRSRIRSIESEMFFGRGDGPRPGPGGPLPKKYEQTFEKTRRSAVERILALLNDEQRVQWKTMTGEEFKGEFRSRPFGPGPKGFGPPPPPSP